MTSNNGPEEEFRDDRRIRLLNDLERYVGLTVPPTVWACLWLSDLDKLEGWVERARHEPHIAILAFGGVEASSWTQRDHKGSTASTPRPSTPSSAPSTARSSLSGHQKRKHDGEQTAGQDTPEHRSTPVEKKCKERDQKSCVITNAGTIDVAHIYPFSMWGHRDSDSQEIWEFLRLFWSDNRVKKWYDAIFPSGTEVCHNLICLNRLAHRYHGKGYFALKPIELSLDKKCLKVAFFWLPHSKSLATRVNICGAPSLAGNDQAPDKARLWNHETGREICSGDELCLKTHDPEDYPLPSMDLLDMQWVLNRLVAIRGAAEDNDDYGNDDYDNDDYDNDDYDSEDYDNENDDDDGQMALQDLTMIDE